MECQERGGGKAMTVKYYVTCDRCTKDIMTDDPPHTTRQEFERQVNEDTVDVLKRRDLCDACALRLRQIIIASLPNCGWLLDGFKVERK